MSQPEQLTAEIRQQVYADIEMRCADNIVKWGDRRSLTTLLWGNVLAEEFGEVIAEIGHHRPQEMRKELIDLVAVGVAMIEAIDDGRFVEMPYPDYLSNPMNFVRNIGNFYGHVARTVLERQGADAARYHLTQLMGAIYHALDQTYTVDYEDRAIEGEDDQQAKGVEINAMATIDLADTAPVRMDRLVFDPPAHTFTVVTPDDDDMIASITRGLGVFNRYEDEPPIFDMANDKLDDLIADAHHWITVREDPERDGEVVYSRCSECNTDRRFKVTPLESHPGLSNLTIAYRNLYHADDSFHRWGKIAPLCSEEAAPRQPLDSDHDWKDQPLWHHQPYNEIQAICDRCGTAKATTINPADHTEKVTQYRLQGVKGWVDEVPACVSSKEEGGK